MHKCDITDITTGSCVKPVVISVISHWGSSKHVCVYYCRTYYKAVRVGMKFERYDEPRLVWKADLKGTSRQGKLEKTKKKASLSLKNTLYRS